TADNGTGSLRDAIITANGSTNAVDFIDFNIPTSDTGYNATTGVWTISPLSALPDLTAPVILDGTSQPGYAGKPLIELNGSNAGASVNGLVVSGGASTVKGFDIGGFSNDGILVNGAGGDTIQANYIGTDPTGAVALANGGYGV
ncbi:MAG TPA: hypothetical protein PK867_07215, partial [Pirellulales bacterium]|nr:hypothetical protein [Pirellulales bacterium]